MQSGAKSRFPDDDVDDNATAEPPRKVHALELPQDGSDGEYQQVSKAPQRKQRLSKSVPVPAPLPGELPEEKSEEQPQPDPSNGQDATDDDWLRGRTNRLLDLMGPEDVLPEAKNAKEPSVEDEEDAAEPMRDVAQGRSETSTPEPQVDPLLEQIRQNGRLFVRNLPYSASEQELQDHFKEYGPLEEVCPDPFFHIPLPRHDEFPDRDSLCLRAYDVNWSSILVDASYF